MTFNPELETRVEQLMRVCDWPRDRAEKAAREQLNLPPADEEPTERDAQIAEKEEQGMIVKLFRAVGIRVYTTSQARPAKVSPGIPDLWCVHKDAGVCFWWESKRQVGGELSTAQQEFRDECAAGLVNWGSGDRWAARAFLVRIGLARDVNGELIPWRQIP